MAQWIGDILYPSNPVMRDQINTDHKKIDADYKQLKADVEVFNARSTKIYSIAAGNAFLNSLHIHVKSPEKEQAAITEAYYKDPTNASWVNYADYGISFLGGSSLLAMTVSLYKLAVGYYNYSSALALHQASLVADAVPAGLAEETEMMVLGSVTDMAMADVVVGVAEAETLLTASADALGIAAQASSVAEAAAAIDTAEAAEALMAADASLVSPLLGAVSAGALIVVSIGIDVLISYFQAKQMNHDLQDVLDALAAKQTEVDDAKAALVAKTGMLDKLDKQVRARFDRIHAALIRISPAGVPRRYAKHSLDDVVAAQKVLMLAFGAYASVFDLLQGAMAEDDFEANKADILDMIAAAENTTVAKLETYLSIIRSMRRSMPNGAPVELSVINQSKTNLRINWISFKGDEVFYADLPAGGRWSVKTGAYNVWTIRLKDHPDELVEAIITTDAPAQASLVPDEIIPDVAA